MNYRKEKDALGDVQVPAESYYGSFTSRALENFQLSGYSPARWFLGALSIVKKSACMANTELGLLDPELSTAMVRAIDEFYQGKFDSEFTLDFFQAGAGTPFNMNINEIVANRANEMLGSAKGSYDRVHPNNHVNMGQSSNDVIPTAIRISQLMYYSDDLRPALEALIGSFEAKAAEGAGILKVGRTHLEDAVPVTVEQEFRAMANMLRKSLTYLDECSSKMKELGLGGTATGTGITADPDYCAKVIVHLRTFSGIDDLYISDDLLEMTQSSDALGIFSSGLRAVANDLIKIANDLKMLNMGPKAGLAEIELPEVEPGSSIMPGKVNPSVAEAVHMAACQIVGNDQAVQLGVQSGQLQLNVMTPMILFNLEFSQRLLKNTADMMREHCVDGIKILRENVKYLLDRSLVFATALVPYLGYQVVAELVNESLREDVPIRNTVIKYGLLSEEELDFVLSPERITTHSRVDIEMRDKIQGSGEYAKYRDLIGK